ncbi:RtcB family protein [Chryseosolibacter indicus]|uniref:3'-phosphate/5'-hydroxy nucleic acid ligase n=1 Tax=Chryseosolibacter indicus TaxID=2782351 RepID=A0ABS5VY03_9BACT|nr:RtcB family protein [Chryseosolibacter indicus]MBT1706287.1 RtcB family protein [Chryseosolibacter indicus]
MNLTGNDLKQIGFIEGKALGLALDLVEKQYTDLPFDDKLALLKQVVNNPTSFINDATLAPVAAELLRPLDDTIALNVDGKSYQIYGADAIEQGALQQMETAMKLPVTVAGALMPDAHQGYGLPIGGVLATNNAVIPYGVGVDIGCRMCMTIYDIPTDKLQEKKEDFKKLLVNNTKFGQATFKKPKDHEIFERKEFSELQIVREMKDRAWQQIGSSGGGNHFVEFGIVEISNTINECNLAPGQYLAVLSHSGSRGLGANIARHYTKVAMDKCKLPQEAKHLAWLDLNTEEGQEYWLAMNLAGDYASACHHQIHERMAIGLRETPLAMIENHHNFAWKEKDANGNEIIVHRKGATPAGKGVLGIIPGSMATPGFIVRGKGLAESINSASHGAGRTMSRTKAKQTILQGHVNKFLKEAGVELIGSGLDEAPMAYKDIHQVMNYQKELVEVLGSFMPKIVRMCGDEKFQEVD